MDEDLPYIAEYAKSGRASCKKCKTSIAKETLRIGIMVQSPHFDGKIPLWHHFHCFFMKAKLTSTGDIKNFASLRYQDQEKIKENMAGGSGKKSNAGSASAAKATSSAASNEFSIEYAKSSRSVCRECSEKIMKGEIRVSKLDYSSEQALRFGPVPAWRHLKCFAKTKDDLEFSESADKLPGFSLLSEEDQATVKAKIKPSKKRKGENGNAEVVKKKVKEINEDEQLFKAQNELFFQYRDQLQKHLSKKKLVELLAYNKQQPLVGESRILDSLADCMMFGALDPCPECKGQLKLGSYTYKCTGDLTAWTKCAYTVKVPKRRAFKIPEEFLEEYEFLKKYKFVKRERIFPLNPEAPSALSKQQSEKPLEKFQIVIVGELSRGKDTAVQTIEEFGGKMMKKVSKNTTCVVTTEEAAKKHASEMKAAEKHNVFVLSENFLDAVKYGRAVDLIKQHQLFPWGGDPVEKFKNLVKKKAKSGGMEFEFKSKMQKMVVTHGKVVVDPDSGLDDVCVYEQDGDIYNAVLGMVNIQRGTNSYYKLQLLKHNRRSKYYVFYSWGRVGTSIGDKRTESFETALEAVTRFKEIYLNKTNNNWKKRKNFQKFPGYFYPLDIDYGEEIVEKAALKPGANSKLPIPVQELICLIFDVESMKKAMLEFEIDLQKMPLGKLSKKQIRSAYSVLTELLQIIQGDKNNVRLLDASNRFYTLIPHDFGLQKPPILDSEYIIKTKTEMLDSLLEIEVAYNLLKNESGDNEDPVDLHYKQLKTDIEILERSTKEFQNIEKYLQNTHAQTHNQYALEILQIFKINRYGELDRYEKFRKLSNKKLLWHGSRVTNFAGILSQGLRIAPPEAPVTGYMFGKGIYFADMVSKSANYCFANPRNPTGLLLLCEVALGNMYEKYQAEFIEKLPGHTHSTKGVGQTGPDPKGSVFEDGVEIPMGTPVTDMSKKNHSLLYNEYIVYDVNQVNIKYLLEVNFKWRR